MEILISQSVTGIVKWDMLTSVNTDMPKEVKYFLLVFYLKFYMPK
jgi:hypothetical protein